MSRAFPFWRVAVGLLASFALGRIKAPHLPDRALPRMQRKVQVMLALYALAAAILGVKLVWRWVLPVLHGQPIMRLYLLAEQGNCPFVANGLANIRTTCSNRTVRFLAWNMPYHVEHHAYPSVPFHALPTRHRELCTTNSAPRTLRPSKDHRQGLCPRQPHLSGASPVVTGRPITSLNWSCRPQSAKPPP